MTWGNSNASSKVRLNYGSLQRAIAAKGNRGKVGQVHCHGNVWARLAGDDIILKLHRTDIITYHPNGERSLYAKGWHTPLTHHWFREAGIHIAGKRPNDWTEKEYFYIAPGRVLYLFYDGMRIDASGHLLTEPQSVTANTPNAEAKGLRKRITHTVKVNFMPHLRLLLGTRWHETVVSWRVGLPGDGIKPLIDAEVDPLPTIAAALRQYHDGDPIDIFKKYVARQYKQYVHKMGLFDVVPYQPKEN